ncbi:hypothetical protein [Spiroplasma phoeniceum]|uniref:Uncharacterized protein n=1 Tax=Spiroplasma phoeniceum P40 TaxID=1276259 RepID=A0A345DM21_9MOLU|nr:hypothetical protein [Spiroplasma phoeniceum]AXF95259.1 hypothetical protein SDAV_00264 [Spiroplasma phoeniceum P40]
MNTTQILVGVEINKNDVPTKIYILEEQSISTTEFKDMTKKVSSMANKVNDWSLKYHKLKEDLKYRIGHHARTVGDFVREKLIINHNWDEKSLENSISRILVTGEKGWKIVDRHFTIKRLLSSGRIYFSKNLTVTKNINGEDIVTKKYGYLYDELYKCLNYEKTNIRDERPGWNKLDDIMHLNVLCRFLDLI